MDEVLGALLIIIIVVVIVFLVLIALLFGLIYKGVTYIFRPLKNMKWLRSIVIGLSSITTFVIVFFLVTCIAAQSFMRFDYFGRGFLAVDDAADKELVDDYYEEIGLQYFDRLLFRQPICHTGNLEVCTHLDTTDEHFLYYKPMIFLAISVSFAAFVGFATYFIMNLPDSLKKEFFSKKIKLDEPDREQNQ